MLITAVVGVYAYINGILCTQSLQVLVDEPMVSLQSRKLTCFSLLLPLPFSYFPCVPPLSPQTSTFL